MPERNSQILKNTGTCGQLKRQHLDRIAEKGDVGSFHYGLVHKPVSSREVVKIPEAEAAEDKK